MQAAPQASPDRHPQIRLLGELEVRCGSSVLTLPASRKTRALLGYLAATARRHRRSELCSLFWEDASDPRAGLRWSLTQIRHVLSGCDCDVMDADRESVALRAGSLSTDIARLKQLTGGGMSGVAREALIEAEGLFRGEFLEGLDVPACYAYHEWCMAEREAASGRHEQILAALLDCHHDEPGQALTYARALVARNPLNENGHVAVMTLLKVLGRRSDALAHYEHSCRIFARELDLAPPPGLVEARAGLDSAPDVAADLRHMNVLATNATADKGHACAGLVGRVAEIAQLASCLDRVVAGRATEAVLVSGVPGIGKSRLLDAFEQRVERAGGRFLRGRTYEVEMVRPFGFWIDALRKLGHGDLPPGICAPLKTLTRGGTNDARLQDRDSLFEAMLAALSWLARSGPVAVLVDDLHWIEASSAALLHYVVRKLKNMPVLFVLTGRAGEMEDNAAAQQLIAALANSGRLGRIALAPLSDVEARTLIDGVAQPGSADRIVAQAQGNPFILLELARSRDATVASSGLLDRILQMRFSGLTSGAAALIGWASAFGRTFPLEGLIATYGTEPGMVGQHLSELERHALISPVDDVGYSFNHELIRQAAYSQVSQPMRRLIHKSIASFLALRMEDAPLLGSEVAYHAGLGGLHVLAARAAVCAGEHGLRVFANREAAKIARRGLRHAARIPEQTARVQLSMALLRVLVLATSGLQLARLRPAVDAIMQVVDEGHTAHLHAEVAQGYYLLSILHQEAGEFDAAQLATLHAAEAADRSDALGRARQLANSARCLVELGRDIAQAREMVAEARSLANSAGEHEIEVRWCAGLLHNWDGESDAAVREIEAAIALATRAEDRWRQCKCLGWVAMIELERRRPKQAMARAAALKLAASQLAEGADEPFALAIDALARQMSGDDKAPLETAIRMLRVADDKSRLACVLNLAAAARFECKQFRSARIFAVDALAMAESIGDVTESVVAQAMLARVDTALGELRRACQALEQLRPALEAPDAFSARAARAALAAAAGAG